MSSNLDYLYECNHRWRDAGAEFKTYHRADASQTNPVRQAQKCAHCAAIRVIVVRYSDAASEKP